MAFKLLKIYIILYCTEWPYKIIGKPALEVTKNDSILPVFKVISGKILAALITFDFIFCL